MSKHAEIRPRPRSVPSVTHVVRTMHGKLYVTVTFDESEMPFEVFVTLGKAGPCDRANLQALSSIASVLLRAGVYPTDIARQLRHLSCCPIWSEGAQIESIPDAIGQVLERCSTGNGPEIDNPSQPEALWL